MHEDISPLLQRISDLLKEAETHLYYKDRMLSGYAKLDEMQKKGRISRAVYDSQIRAILQGKTKEDAEAYYNSCIYSLFKQIEVLNGEIFYRMFRDKSENDIKIDNKLLAAIEKAKKSSAARRKAEALKRKIEEENIRKEEQRKERLKLKLEEKRRVLEMREIERKRREAEAEKKAKESAEERAKKLEKRLGAKAVKAKETPVKEGIAEKTPFITKEKKKFESAIFTTGAEGESITLEKAPTFAQKRISKFKYFISKVLGMEKKETFVGKETTISPSVLRLERLREKAGEALKTEAVSATLLTEEAKKIHSILERKKGMRAYKAGIYMSFANRVVKNASYWMLKQFPDFFKKFYTTLRLANIQILSNTYVNVMVLSSLLGVGIGFLFFFIFFTALMQPLQQIAVKSIILSVVVGVIIFLLFYTLPMLKIKKRRRSINTNLPFAINHMAAVVGSGVSPTRMFELISESDEYGEIAVEIAKIVEFVRLFGYDMITAVKTVAATTPSEQLKDFFEGLESNVESGGDINNYLRQKSDESMVNYELERRKYVETVSTYSDIYTGILIAAPLFFVAALSLVGMLGGAIGGMDVNLVIVLGTYIVIPLLNILFLIFLQATQPEI